MTDKAQPFTKAERAHMMRDIEERLVIFAPLAKRRYEATVALVEGRRDELVACANALIDEVASLRKERDELAVKLAELEANVTADYHAQLMVENRPEL